MKKKIVVLCLILSLLAVAVIGTSLAYFSDTKEVTNTFVVGSVKIDLHESNGLTGQDEKLDEDYRDWLQEQIIIPGEANALGKEVWVTNTGKNGCYVRVWLAVPTYMDISGKNDTDWTWENKGQYQVYADAQQTTVITYDLYCVTYNDILASADPDAVTPNVMEAVFMRPTVTNEDVENITTLDVLVVAQAIQTEGVADASGNIAATAAEALNVGFPDENPFVD